jgi:putative tryptophan/tyrosine transport system substrate-binding protein
MKRREFITLLGGAAAWPLAAEAQRADKAYRIGYLGLASAAAQATRMKALREGLAALGYIEGKNIVIEERRFEGAYDQLALAELAAQLADLKPDVIVTHGPGVLAAKHATTTIPIVIAQTGDAVATGLVASLARPGGNLTGVNFFTGELAAKRLEFLHQLVPGAAHVRTLLNPTNPNAKTVLRDVEVAARSMGLQIQVINASTIGEIEAAFATFVRERPDALFVSGDPIFRVRRIQLALLAAHYRVPAIYALRDYAEAGGLMSYGASLSDAHRQGGVYVGRILKGAKPADLPVVQSSKFELVINLPTARMLGLTVPPTLLATVDEVIE